MKLALGIIETVGLAAAIVAADTALKTANIELIGYELSKGDGLVAVKIQGDVSAVDSAIKSARISAEKVNKVFSTTIIARPHEEIDRIVLTKDTVGILNLDYSNGEETNEGKNIGNDENLLIDKSSNVEASEQYLTEEESRKILIEQLLDSEDIKETKATCNICMDPKCPRKKGEPRNICIHHN